MAAQEGVWTVKTGDRCNKECRQTIALYREGSPAIVRAPEVASIQKPGLANFSIGGDHMQGVLPNAALRPNASPTASPQQ